MEINGEGQKGIITLVTLAIVLAVVFPVIREFLVVATASVLIFVIIGLILVKKKKGRDE